MTKQVENKHTCSECSHRARRNELFTRFVQGPIVVIILGWMTWSFANDAISVKTNMAYVALMFAILTGGLCLWIIWELVLPLVFKSKQ